MSFWLQMCISMGQSALRAILAQYGSDLFTLGEQETLAATGDLLTDLPRRIKAAKGK